MVPDYAEAYVSGYVNAAYTVWRRVRLIAGAHANKAPDLDVDVVPRVGVVAPLTEHLTWKVLYGEAFRSPDVFERFSKIGAIVGDSLLDPERIATLESQVAFTGRDLSVALSAFWSRQSNLVNRRNVADSLIIHGVVIPVTQKYVNEGEIESRGAELEGVYQTTRHLSLTGSVAWQENETESGLEDQFGVPNLLAKAGATFARPQGSVGLFVSHYDYLDEVTGYAVPHPDANAPAESFTYATLNARLNWKSVLHLHPGAPEIASEIFLVNLLDQDIHYPEHGRRFVNSTPGRPGFAWYARLRVSL